MAIAKVILNGETLMDVTSNTVTSENLLSGQTAIGNNGEPVTGGLVGGPYYGIYKCLTDKQYPLMASGSSYYGYTSAEVSDWCNSYSQLNYAQFAGACFSGSFYFNNVSSINRYGFAHPYINGGLQNNGGAHFYFPILTIMSSGAFAYNSNISTIVCSSCSTIYTYAFESCIHLSSISFPNCSEIGEYAFYYCIDLVNISFPNCTTISGYAFNLCTRLQNINFPNCITIGSYAFARCSALTTVNLPKCELIGSNAFSGCSSLVSISLSSCISIKNGAFSSCIALNNVYLPNCTSLDINAFAKCSALIEINLPNCEMLGSNAFSNCYELTTVNLLKVSTIYATTFQSCYNLISLYLLSDTVCTLRTINAFSSTPIYNYSTSAGQWGSVFVPSSLYADYCAASNWSLISSRIVSV